MSKLCKLLNFKDEDELFDKITKSFKDKITLWNYFVDWDAVFNNIKPIEKELNLLNYLIGKENVEKELAYLIYENPKIINAIPILLAIRCKKKKEKFIKVLIDNSNFIYETFDFTLDNITIEKCEKIAYFFMNSGFGSLVKDRTIKNFVDYVYGVEVGIGSNGRKNRTGKLMEGLVEKFILDACQKSGLIYMRQATAKKIKQQWGLDVIVDKSSRQLDFAINKNGKLFFIEVNFYGGTGSKLKSTATEYIEMNRYWNNQGIEFIWITDGIGWSSTLRPLREYFDKADYLLNLGMLNAGDLLAIIEL